MILTVTFNPSIDKTARTQKVESGKLHRLSDVISDAGGKGINVSKTLKALGEDSLALGFLAGTPGKFIEDKLDELEIGHDFIQVDGQTRTNLKVLDENNTLSEFNEPGPEIGNEEVEALIEKITDHAGPDDLVVLSGNVSPGVSKDVYKTIISALNGKGIGSILDADGELFAQGIQAGPKAIKPNRFELAQYFGLPQEEMSLEKMRDLARQLLNDKTQLAVVSMGSDGSLFVTKDEALAADALKIDYKSAVGAGDAMVASIAYGLEHGLILEELARLAVAVSAGACLSAGTSPADLETVNELKEQVVLKPLEA